MNEKQNIKGASLNIPGNTSQITKLSAVACNRYVVAFFLSAIIFALYLPVANFSFINFDDDIYITANKFVQSGLTKEGLFWAFSDTSTGHWHPLTWLSYMLDVELFGATSSAIHLVNAALHSISTGLLFLILAKVTGSVGGAFVAAAIFGMHPLRIESVAWASQRKDVLSMLLGLITIRCYLASIAQRRWYTELATIFAFVAALLAKPTVITLPLLLLCLDYWLLQRFTLKAIVEKIPLCLVAVLFCGIVIYAQHAGSGLRNISEVSLDTRLTTVAVGYLSYFGKFFLPAGLGIFYPLTNYAPGVGAGAFCGLVAISLCVFGTAVKRPYLTFGWCWFLISLLPVVGFVQIGGQTFADRWTYLPHIGLAVGAVWFIREQLQQNSWRLKTALQRLIAGVALIICGYLTTINLPNWRDSVALFSHTLKVSPNNFMAHTNLGTALDTGGQMAQAAIHFEEAVRLNPTYPEALNNLGSLRARQGRMREAQELFQRAVAIRPNFTAARYHLALSQYELGDRFSAGHQWVEILITDPTFTRARESLNFLATAGKIPRCEDATSATARSARTSLQKKLLEWRADTQDLGTRAKLLLATECP